MSSDKQSPADHEDKGGQARDSAEIDLALDLASELSLIKELDEHSETFPKEENGKSEH